MIRIPKRSFSPSGPKDRKGFACLMIAIATYIALMTLLIACVTPLRYELSVGEIATQTITATKDIEDTLTTERLRASARAQIAKRYFDDDELADEVMSEIGMCFDRLQEARKNAELWMESQIAASQPRATLVPFVPEGTDAVEAMAPTPDPSPTPTPSPTPAPPTFTKEFIESQRKYVPVDLTDDQFRALFALSDASFQSMREYTEQAVRGIYGDDNDFKEGTEEAAVKDIADELRSPVYAIPRGMIGVIEEILTAYLRANTFYDEAKTEADREAAAEAVEPVMYKKGQNIVKQGELVTESQVNLISGLGLLKENEFDVELYTGLAGCTLLLFVAFAMYLLRFEPTLLRSPKRIALLSVVLLTVLLIAWPMRYLNIYLIPTVLGALLVCLLLELRVALVFNVILSIFAGIVSTGSEGLFGLSMFNVFISGLLGGWVVIFSLDRWRGRSTIILAGVLAGLTNLLTMMAIGMMTNASLITTSRNAGFAGLGGLIAAVIGLGVSPLLEYLFGIATPSKLLELSNPNQPLLRRLLLEAPGTYHHSIIVGNLAEAAADAIGANTLLCRVGSYYHDVGKLMRPGYFRENQLSDRNPHDALPPEQSASILTAHTRDGYALAAAERLPRVVLDLIVQHHGTTSAAYFLHRAKELYGEVDEAPYRYAGPKPQSREAAILMLADTVEAATRSIKGPTHEKIEGLTRKLVKAKVEDGQLDETPMTLADIEVVTSTFIAVLGGIYHERIEYPKSEAIEQQKALPLDAAMIPVEPAGGSGET